jgi:hypothetical protein
MRVREGGEAWRLHMVCQTSMSWVCKELIAFFALVLQNSILWPLLDQRHFSLSFTD